MAPCLVVVIACLLLLLLLLMLLSFSIRFLFRAPWLRCGMRDVATSTAGIKAGVDEQRTAGRTRTASSVCVRVRVRVRVSFTQVLQFSTSPGIL